VSKRTRNNGIAKKVWKARKTSYYSGLERGIEDSKAGSRGVNTEPAGSFSGETGQCTCVVAKYIG
jgi:hypothetical protein